MNYRSPITNLLSGISWEGRRVTKKYRQGGQGVEDVLTVQVMQALEFLPRHPFTYAWAQGVHGLNGAFSGFISEGEAESAEYQFAPGGALSLRPTRETHQERIEVQFDAHIETSESQVFIEAKRMGTSSFQEEQLARSYLIALRESAPLKPRLLLILGSAPPVKVKNVGRTSIYDGILNNLRSVYDKTEGMEVSFERAVELIPETVGYITWHELSLAIDTSLSEYSNPHYSTERAVQRVASSLTRAVEWHANA